MSYAESYSSHISEFNRMRRHSAATYLKKALKLSPFSENGKYQKGGFLDESFSSIGSPFQLNIEYDVVNGFAVGNDNSLSILNRTHERQKLLNSFYGYIIRLQYFFSFAVETPGFTSHAVPYILFFVAILVPALKAHNFIF